MAEDEEESDESDDDEEDEEESSEEATKMELDVKPKQKKPEETPKTAVRYLQSLIVYYINRNLWEFGWKVLW